MTTSWQLTAIRTEVRERMGLSTGDTAVTDAILTDLVNAANRKISLYHDWPWLVQDNDDFVATVVGQRKYDVTVPADDWRKTLVLVVDGDQVLSPKQPQDIHRYANQTGFPYFYAISGTDIYLAPTPDAVYTVLHMYVKDPAVLSGDTDVVAVEDWAIDLLIEQTCVLVAKRLRDDSLARSFQEELSITLESMRDEVRRTRQLPLPRHRTDVAWP